MKLPTVLRKKNFLAFFTLVLLNIIINRTSVLRRPKPSLKHLEMLYFGLNSIYNLLRDAVKIEKLVKPLIFGLDKIIKSNNKFWKIEQFLFEDPNFLIVRCSSLSYLP